MERNNLSVGPPRNPVFDPGEISTMNYLTGKNKKRTGDVQEEFGFGLDVSDDAAVSKKKRSTAKKKTSTGVSGLKKHKKKIFAAIAHQAREQREKRQSG